jgi:hypothetical protein
MKFPVRDVFRSYMWIGTKGNCKIIVSGPHWLYTEASFYVPLSKELEDYMNKTDSYTNWYKRYRA